MLIFAMSLVEQLTPIATPPPPTCRASQLRISLDARNGDFNGMSHSGIEVSIRNLGQACILGALPTIQLRDVRGRALPVVRRTPVGMHPGPVMVPVRLSAGHRAATQLRWVSGPVYPHSRALRAARVALRIGRYTLQAPMAGVVYAETGKGATFEQPPLRVMEGMAAG